MRVLGGIFHSRIEYPEAALITELERRKSRVQLLINEKQDQIQVDSEIKELLKRALETVLEGEAFSQEFIDAVEVSLVLTDDSEMAELNDYYRG